MPLAGRTMASIQFVQVGHVLVLTYEDEVECAHGNVGPVSPAILTYVPKVVTILSEAIVTSCSPAGPATLVNVTPQSGMEH